MKNVHVLIEHDRRITTRQIEKFFIEEACDPISHTTICEIIHRKLEMSKMCARWVPKLLTPEHTEKRMGMALAFLSWYQEKGESLVVEDEARTNSSQMQTREIDRQDQSHGFWDAEGISVAEYGADKLWINKDTYFNTLMRLRAAIKNKRPGRLPKKIFRIHDNARPHSIKIIRLS